MAIYIDENVYKEDCDEDLIYQYLYHIICMLAYKYKYFQKSQQYDEFALQSATYIYMRLKNGKQDEWDFSKGTYKLEKIKSILNYIKSVMYPMKVMFEQDNYSQQYQDKEFEVEENSNQLMLVRQHLSAFNHIEFDNYFDSIGKLIQDVVKTSPYTDRVINKNIRISCILTLLNMVTLDNDVKDKIIGRSDKVFQNEYLITKLFRENQENAVILYNLPKDMENYIFVLVNKIKRMISDEVSELIQSWEIPDNMVKNILLESVFESDLVEDICL
jgi:hypothetical protein